MRLKLLDDPSKKSQYEHELRHAIRLYHVQWKSATRLPSLLRSSLKLGYLQLFGATLALLMYGLIRSDVSDFMTWVVASVVVVDLIYEIAIFPRKTYLEFAPMPEFVQ